MRMAKSAGKEMSKNILAGKLGKKHHPLSFVSQISLVSTRCIQLKEGRYIT
jgi:hypothetical protein